MAERETGDPADGAPARAPGGALGAWFDRAAALVLLVLGLPLFGLIGLAILAVNGRPILYGGDRLGRRKRPFRMLKFRTLVGGADRITGAAVIESPGRLAIPLGKFLRDTRLDELPQLVNIVRGEMAFIGPRPERPEVYAAVCVDIPGYERRFAVRPGLIGIAQLYTPSGTDKRYRTLIDNRSLSRPRSALRGACVVPFTVWHVLRTILSRAAESVREAIDTRILRRYSRRRRHRRVRLARACVRGAPSWNVVDMNENAFRIRSREPIVDLPRAVELELELDLRAARPRFRRAVCRARIYARRSDGTGYDTVVAYRPTTPRSHYMLHQYFLRESFAFEPHRARDKASVERGLPPAPSPSRAPTPPVPAETPQQVEAR